MIRKTLIAISALILVSGCYSMQGSERVLDRHGNPTTAVPTGSVFQRDFNRAYTLRTEGENVVQADVDRMLSSGFTHIYTFCDNYFDVMGLQQRRSRVIRDAIAPISALITGIIALHSFETDPGGKEDLLALLGLATASTSSMLDIYDQHMLFGAENIGAVETLTMAALSAHRTRVRDADTISFDAAVRHLIDNQAQCSPQHILTLTREAIREGRVQARPVTSDGEAFIEGSSEEGEARVATSINNSGN